MGYPTFTQHNSTTVSPDVEEIVDDDCLGLLSFLDEVTKAQGSLFLGHIQCEGIPHVLDVCFTL